MFNAARLGGGAVGQEPERRAVRRAGAQHRPGRRQSQLQRATNLRRVVYLSLVASLSVLQLERRSARASTVAVAMPSYMPGFMRHRRASRTADSIELHEAARRSMRTAPTRPVSRIAIDSQTVPSCPSRISDDRIARLAEADSADRSRFDDERPRTALRGPSSVGAGCGSTRGSAWRDRRSSVDRRQAGQSSAH